MHRFFVSLSLTPGQTVVLESTQAHQICRVLRLAVNESIILLDGQGTEYEVELQVVSAKQVQGKVKSEQPAGGEPGIGLILFQSMLKRDKFEWVLQKATEVGVTEIVPVITERSLVRKAQTFKSDRLTRWSRILTEAAEQSHRGKVPRLQSPLPFTEALTLAERLDRALLACPHAESNSLADILRGLPTGASCGLFVGPEGGFSAEEVLQAQVKGVLPITLGRRILRTETAAIVAASLILYECGEFQPGEQKTRGQKTDRSES